MIDENPADGERMELPLLVVELVGVAGAGKSSLSRALIQSDGGFVQGANLEVRKLGHMPFFLMNAIFLLPNLLRGSPTGRWFTWQEIKMMVYLQGWHRVMERRSSSDGVVVLDQGPVYKLPLFLGMRRHSQLRLQKSLQVSSKTAYLGAELALIENTRCVFLACLLSAS